MVEIARQRPALLGGHVAVGQGIELAYNRLRGGADVIARGDADQIDGTEKTIEHSSPIVRRALPLQLIGLIQIVIIDDWFEILFSFSRRGVLERLFLRGEITLAILDCIVDEVLNALA